MTDRSPLRCRQVEEDLLAGPSDPIQARRIANHLVTCARCRGLNRRLTQDRDGLSEYLDNADWLPVANRVLAALPDHTSRPAAARADGHVPAGGDQRHRPGQPAAIRRIGARPGPLATAVRAACLVMVGLGLGLVLPQVWPGGGDALPAGPTEIAATGGQDGALGAQPGTGEQATTDTGSVYVPAPGGNPPLVVPGGNGGITASQNEATWSSVDATVTDTAGVLLYPPVPPGIFDSVVIEALAPGAFAVRYAAEDMSLVMTAGRTGGDPTVSRQDSTGATVRGQTATVRGATATVTVVETAVPGRGGLRLDGQESTALAAGTVVEVTWIEPAPSGSVMAGTAPDPLPYRVTAAGLPVDLVLTFVDGLIPVTEDQDGAGSQSPAVTNAPTPAATARSRITRPVDGTIMASAFRWAPGAGQRDNGALTVRWSAGSGGEGAISVPAGPVTAAPPGATA